MKTPVLFVSCGIIFAIMAAFHLRADQLEMQNGDRYVGKILSVSADTVLLQSDVLGKINLPRSKVASLAFGTNAASPKVADNVAPVSVPTNLPDVTSLTALAKSNTNLAATGSNLSANADVVRQIREQMLAGSPEAAGKFDELVSGYTSGKLNVNDLRREAKSSADQLRKLKSELGPEVGDSLDGYLEILDGFLKESATGTTNVIPNARSNSPGRK